MPTRQPFTALCRVAARPLALGRADLHLHTTHSDGTYTPSQIVDLARRTGLAAVAVTDHDTLAGVPEAEEAAAGTGVEVIPGVEVSAEDEGREFHVLGYFVRRDDPELDEALRRLRHHRVERFWDMVERLRACGVSLEDEELGKTIPNVALSRRNLAELLVKARRVGTVREAFQRYLGDNGRVALPKVRLPVAVALGLIRRAGGVASWAHPPYDDLRGRLACLREQGLGAVEAEYPGFRPGRVQELKVWAAALGLAVTGGSDCHGPDQPGRGVGARTLSEQELCRLRALIPG